jgi:hypothetical protein
MALVTRASTAQMDVSTGQFAPQIAGLVAGEDLDVAAPCYIKSSDGKVYMCNGTAANEAAEVVGFTPRAVKAGQPVTLFGKGTRFGYGSGLTPGDVLYVGATAGRLDAAATAGDAVGVAQVITATDIRVLRDGPALKVAKTALAGGFLKAAVVAGGAAGNFTVTGIAAADELVAVLYFAGAGTDVTNVADLLSEFSISAANTINNTGGTASTGGKLVVLYLDLS